MQEKAIKMLELKFCTTLVKRIICVILIAFEIDRTLISEKLKLSVKSIKKYENMLNKGLVEELLTIKGNSRKSELDDYKEEILSELELGEYKTLRQIAAMIKSKTGLVRSRHRINVFLKKTATAQSK
jgi:transposase